jgi:hypothetical protein
LSQLQTRRQLVDNCLVQHRNLRSLPAKLGKGSRVLFLQYRNCRVHHCRQDVSIAVRQRNRHHAARRIDRETATDLARCHADVARASSSLTATPKRLPRAQAASPLTMYSDSSQVW